MAIDETEGAKNRPMSVSTVHSMVKRRSTTCQHALGMLRSLAEAPEAFVPGRSGTHNVSLPSAGPDRRRRRPPG
jgi:hypothetical protein